LVAPFMNTFSPGMLQGKPELASGQLVDSNSLPRQSLTVGLFATGLVVLTIFARTIQR
jgi:hypothetical protein